MLVAGSTSACDVCLEPFGGDSKAPCTITCGHVFCVDCLANINPPLCPLCRKIFDPRFTVKLHLDLDNVRAPPSPNGASAPNDDDARRLYQAISNIAEAGCSETQVRQLISEGKSFLQKQPKDSFKDLRTLYRMVAYLCEVKTTLRAQNAANEALKREHAQLQAEKNELVAKIEQQLRVREQERQAAWATESSLRDHCTKAHEAYETMVQQYNYVAKEWTRMNEEIKRLRAIASQERLTGSPSLYADARYSPHELDQANLVGAAVRDEGSILISPLPQFTTKFNTTISMFKPLPDLEETDEEEYEDDDDDEEASEESEVSDIEKAKSQPSAAKYQPTAAVLIPAVCSHPRHPHSCGCVAPAVPSDDLTKSRTTMARASSEQLSSAPRVETIKQEERAFQIPSPSGISRTAPYAERRSRSHSIPSQGSSSRTPSSSRPSSRSVSPARPPVPSRPAVQRSAPSYEASGQRSADNDGLRSRLHNILADSSSSSPPKATLSYSTSVRENSRSAREERRRSTSRSPSPSSSGSRRQTSQIRPSQQQQTTSTTDQFSRLLASHQHASSGIAAPLSTSPNPRTSSASDAARALEQSKRERQQADRERRMAGQTERSYPDRETERMRHTPHPHAAASQRDPVSSTSHSTSTSASGTRSYTQVSPSKAMPVPSSTRDSSQTQSQSQHPHQHYQSRHHTSYSQSHAPYAPNAPGLYV